MVQSTNPSPQSTAPETQVYTVSVILALSSFLLVLLVLPPLFWHLRNRNTGATSLVAWIIVLLFSTFLNAIIWSSDNTGNWFSGIVLCDIEVRIQSAAQVALPASFAAVLRGLARVLDTEHATLMLTKAQRRRNLTIDLLFCVAAPLLQIVFYELIHYRRYAIYGIAGCAMVVNDGWPPFVLMSVPPLLWTIVDAVYAVIILIRLYRYRLTFSSILSTAQTTKSRFLRLYLICCIWVLGFLPISLYFFAARISVASIPFSWSETHDHAAYHDIFLIPSNGVVFWDRWVWLVMGVCAFVFFGFGREAVGMYRTGLLAVGMGRVFPALKRDPARRPTVSTISSISSKAKMLFKRKSFASETTWTSTTNSSASRSRSQTDDPISPKTATFLEAIREISPERDIEKATQAQPKVSFLSRLASIFHNVTARRRSSAPVPLAELTNEDATVRSMVSAGQRPLSFVKHVRDTSSDVLVRKEVRQGSEHEK